MSLTTLPTQKPEDLDEMAESPGMGGKGDGKGRDTEKDEQATKVHVGEKRKGREGEGEKGKGKEGTQAKGKEMEEIEEIEELAIDLEGVPEKWPLDFVSVYAIASRLLRLTVHVHQHPFARLVMCSRVTLRRLDIHRVTGVPHEVVVPTMTAVGPRRKHLALLLVIFTMI
jgi:hypothetical protein